jgi:CCR4-NOT transcription complex subunit 6
MMNGAQGHQRFGNMQMHKNQQQHYNPHAPMGHHHQHHGPLHQHNISGGFSNAQHHVLGFQDQMPNGGSEVGHDDLEDPDNEHWKEQQNTLQDCRDLNGPNQRAKLVAQTAKGISYIGSDDANTDRSKRSGALALQKADPNKSAWDELDLGGQGLHALSPVLFDAYKFVKRLNLGWNNLTVLPSAIGQLKKLEHLDVSFNQLTELPPEIGMLSNLKQLHLFGNRIQTLPYEIGFLFKLEMLGVAQNPLESGQKDKITEGGTKALVVHLKESMPGKLCIIVAMIIANCFRTSAAP